MPDMNSKYLSRIDGTFVWREYARRGWLDPAVLLPDENARLNLSMDGQDGSVAEVELTADFTGLRRRVLGALSAQG